MPLLSHQFLHPIITFLKRGYRLAARLSPCQGTARLPQSCRRATAGLRVIFTAKPIPLLRHRFLISPSQSYRRATAELAMGPAKLPLGYHQAGARIAGIPMGFGFSCLNANYLDFAPIGLLPGYRDTTHRPGYIGAGRAI